MAIELNNIPEFPRRTVLLFVEGCRLDADCGDGVELAPKLFVRMVSPKLRQELIASGVESAEAVIRGAAFFLESRARSNEAPYVEFDFIKAAVLSTIPLRHGGMIAPVALARLTNPNWC